MIIDIKNVCLGCGVEIDHTLRYCPDCQKSVNLGLPRDSFGRFMPTLMQTKGAYLLRSDVEILDADPTRQIRPNYQEHIAVKHLYEIWKSL